MTKIKICGLSRIQDIEAVNSALPDYIGFVFAKSRRQVDNDTAAMLKRALDTRIKAVGVFVNEEITKIQELCRSGIIDMVQLHGDEDNGYIKSLRGAVNVPIIKGVRGGSDFNTTHANSFDCDYLLFDTYMGNEYGGTGKSFDWSLLKNFKKPFFLAGGIDIKNIKTAIKTANPYCVDVSSGVETDGVKDETKIKEIVGFMTA